MSPTNTLTINTKAISVHIFIQSHEHSDNDEKKNQSLQFFTLK